MTDPIRAALERLVKASELVLRFDRWMPDLRDAIAAGKAALAEQQGEGPSDEEWDASADDIPPEQLAWAQARASDEELLELAQQHCISCAWSDGTIVSSYQEGTDMRSEVLSFARAVLARWGHQK